MCKLPQGYTLSVISKYNIISPHTRSEVGDLGGSCTTGKGKRVNQGQVSAEKRWWWWWRGGCKISAAPAQPDDDGGENSLASKSLIF